jgi:hypothetical protein
LGKNENIQTNNVKN